jgi:hypothetical protein
VASLRKSYQSFPSDATTSPYLQSRAPPPDFIHRSQAKQIQAQLDQLLGEDRALTEQPIETDTAWKVLTGAWPSYQGRQRARSVREPA